MKSRVRAIAGLVVFLAAFLVWQNWSVNAQSAHGIHLTWTASATPSVDGYTVYRGTTTGQTNTKLNSALTTSLTFDDVSGNGGTLYFYTVSATKGGIESARSNEVSGTFPLVPAAPAGVTATPF